MLIQGFFMLAKKLKNFWKKLALQETLLASGCVMSANASIN